MEYFTTDLDGVTLIDPESKERQAVLASVEGSTDDYPEVYLTHSCGMAIGYRQGGFMVREERGEVTGVLQDIDPKKASIVWDLLVAKDLDGLDALPWKEE